MKRFVPFLFALALPAADKPAPAAAINDSLSQQRQSIEKQLRSLGQASFFMLPPPLPMSAVPGAADCDPLPEDQVNALTDEAAKKEGLKPELLRAIIRQESGFRPCAVSAKGAQGLMQLMPATAEQFGQDNELTYLFDRETHRPVFRVVNRKTRKVTGQIAPERVLEIARDSAR